MAKLPDPMDTLAGFQAAVRRGAIEIRPGEIHPGIRVAHDQPEGTPRLTYAKVEHGRVKALAVFVATTPISGAPCFNIGYAVPEAYRGKGWGKEILAQAIDEMQNGFARSGVKKFYVEAIVGVDNEPSKRLAAHVISDNPKSTTDGETGQAVLAYTRLIGDAD